MANCSVGPLTIRSDTSGQYKWHVVRDCTYESQNASAYHTLTDVFERLQDHGWEYTTTTMPVFTIDVLKSNVSNSEYIEALLKSPPAYMHHFRKRKEQPTEPEPASEPVPATPPPPPKKHKRK